MNKIKTFLQGFIVGLGKIIPGVSGSVMAVCFGIYERIISALSSLSVLKSDFKFISTLGLGLVIAIVLGSNVIKILLIACYIPTMMFFIGMMIPGLFPIIKEVKNKDLTVGRVIICLTILFLLVYLNVLGTTSHVAENESYFHEFISLFLCGIIDAATTVIPGISGSALLMLFGYYEKIISSLANVFSLTSISTLIPFLAGISLGVVLTSKLVTYLFKNHRVMTYMLIIVFAVFSILAVLCNTISLAGGVIHILPYVIFTILGCVSTYLLERIFKE